MHSGQSPEERELLGEEMGWNPFSAAWSGIKSAGKSVGRFFGGEKTDRALIQVFPTSGREAQKGAYAGKLHRREYRALVTTGSPGWAWIPVGMDYGATPDEAISKAKQRAARIGLRVVSVTNKPL